MKYMACTISKGLAYITTLYTITSLDRSKKEAEISRILNQWIDKNNLQTVSITNYFENIEINVEVLFPTWVFGVLESPFPPPPRGSSNKCMQNNDLYNERFLTLVFPFF